jgi:hypothetical protein
MLDINNMTLNDSSDSNISASTTSSTVTTTKRFSIMPKTGKATVYKSSRGADQLCLGGFTYQIKKKLRFELKWTCNEKKTQHKCSATIKTSENQSTKENPVYQFVSGGSFPHNHAPDTNKQFVSNFTAQLKVEAERARTIPASKIRNDLATKMKLTDTQMGTLPKASATSKYACMFFFLCLRFFFCRTSSVSCTKQNTSTSASRFIIQYSTRVSNSVQ